jgi:hypothetical protein
MLYTKAGASDKNDDPAVVAKAAFDALSPDQGRAEGIRVQR